MEIKINREEISNPEEILLLDDLECSIDMMISLNPYICRKCENVFCQDCIVNWTKKSSNCPMRCNPFNYSLLENSILKTQINKIKLFCCNKINGCKEACLITDKEKHEKTCEYGAIQCNKCKSLVPQKLLNDHYFKACEKMKIKCTVCNGHFSLFNFIEHLEQCYINIKNCEFCFERIVNSGQNKNANDSKKEHLDDCECKIAYCQICQMPELSNRIEFTHKHRDKANQDENMTIQVCNFYKLMNSFDDKFKSNFNAIENEKEYIMNNALEVFEFITNNQIKIIEGIEANITALKKQEDERIRKLKAERLNENKQLEKELRQIENKISMTEEEIKNLTWMYKEQKAIMDSKNDLIIKRKTDSVNNLLLIYSNLKNLESKKKNFAVTRSSFGNSSLNSNISKETLFEIYNDINNYIITDEEEGEKKQNENFNGSISINKYSSNLSSKNLSSLNNNQIQYSNGDNYKNFSKQDSIIKMNQNINCFKCGGNTEIKNCLTCKKHICMGCVGKCCNKFKQEHQNNYYCKDCLRTCYLCGIITQCSQCAMKCFNKNCNFYFCTVCFDKNKHQNRPENTNCKFYKCESCNTDGNCIMATIYCSSCDIRICRSCLQKDHIQHIFLSK